MSSRKLMPSHLINGALVVPTLNHADSSKPNAQSSDNSTEKSTTTTDKDIEIEVETFSRDSMTDVTIDEHMNDAQIFEMMKHLGMIPSFSASAGEEEEEKDDSREKLQIAFKCVKCNSELPCMFISVGYKHDYLNESTIVKPIMCRQERLPEWKHEYTIPYVD